MSTAAGAFVRAADRISVACAVVAAVCLAAAMLVVAWMVIWRATGHSTYWEIEMAVYLIVWSVLIGSPYCLMTRGHIGVDLLSHLLAAPRRRVLERILAVVGMAVCLYLAWRGAQLTYEVWHSGETSGSSWNPLRWPLFLSMPVGLGLTAVQYVAEMLRGEPPAAPGAFPGERA
jgi:TRAP-type C4-dicarboxylate transport system permease small subunit